VHDLTLIRGKRIAPLAALAASALLLAACSNAGSGATTAPTTAAQPPATSAATAEATAGASQAAEGYEVELGDSDKYGHFLTGEDGKTLYLFTPDTTSASSCIDKCATNWPPFTVDDKSQLKADSGVTGTLDVISRDDGSKQVTYNGLPLYYYAADTAAGDTKGEGVADKWHVAKP